MTTEKNNEGLAWIESNPPQQAKATVIWLHGLGASGDDFVPMAAELQQLTRLSLRFIFPQAPRRPVTINHGYVMPAWYDIFSFDEGEDIDQAGIAGSVGQIKRLINAEKQQGFANNKIILAGFSQGAVIALSTLLASSEALGGVIALSGYLPLQELPPAEHVTPIFWGHGQEDEIVPCRYGQTACETLKKAGYPTTWHSYGMAHSVCDQEIGDMARWLQGILL